MTSKNHSTDYSNNQIRVTACDGRHIATLDLAKVEMSLVLRRAGHVIADLHNDTGMSVEGLLDSVRQFAQERM